MYKHLLDFSDFDETVLQNIVTDVDVHVYGQVEKLGGGSYNVAFKWHFRNSYGRLLNYFGSRVVRLVDIQCINESSSCKHVDCKQRLHVNQFCEFYSTSKLKTDNSTQNIINSVGKATVLDKLRILCVSNIKASLSRTLFIKQQRKPFKKPSLIIENFKGQFSHTAETVGILNVCHDEQKSSFEPQVLFKRPSNLEDLSKKRVSYLISEAYSVLLPSTKSNENSYKITI